MFYDLSGSEILKLEKKRHKLVLLLFWPVLITYGIQPEIIFSCCFITVCFLNIIITKSSLHYKNILIINILVILVCPVI